MIIKQERERKRAEIREEFLKKQQSDRANYKRMCKSFDYVNSELKVEYWRYNLSKF